MCFVAQSSGNAGYTLTPLSDDKSTYCSVDWSNCLHFVQPIFTSLPYRDIEGCMNRHCLLMRGIILLPTVMYCRLYSPGCYWLHSLCFYGYCSPIYNATHSKHCCVIRDGCSMKEGVCGRVCALSNHIIVSESSYKQYRELFL